MSTSVNGNAYEYWNIPRQQAPGAKRGERGGADNAWGAWEAQGARGVRDARAQAPAAVAENAEARKLLDGRDQRALVAYIAATVFCLFFSAVYGLFSHGVSSVFMSYAALIPLFGGLVVPLALRLLGTPRPGRAAFNAYNSGITTFTLGSMLQGVFEIAGTGSAFIWVYVVLGSAFVVAAVLLAAWEAREAQRAGSNRQDG